jgi:hypothetical protein
MHKDRHGASLEYLLIARHGIPERPQKTEEVARRLAETLDELWDALAPLRLATVVHAGTPASRWTAKTLVRELGAATNARQDRYPPASWRAPEKAQLSPESFPSLSPQCADENVNDAQGAIETMRKRGGA